ncbi:hypothetical protein Tsubulata_047746 [Turnera subulata]|uniref:GRAM domain-containing protein n=1 Tax=Turnera subulata TaxID=218843 RepID=A0A9Q0FVS4_9ROSI|nr:hypothetical protein Tsubulata_047746 [Turnera subulata]
MNGAKAESQPFYPSVDPPSSNQANPSPQSMSQSYPTPDQEAETHKHAPASSYPAPPEGSESTEKWGTHVMGTPAVPTCHPDNKKAALWGANGEQAQYFHHPYLLYSPVEKSSSGSPMESILHVFTSWGNKADTMARNIWQNLRTNPSLPGAAWGKMNLTAKAIAEGGFESLYKQIFATYPNEKLKKTFACYLSTTTGPVAGTLYLSDAHAAFCSDRPLSFTAPSGQETWSYYKILIPLSKIGTINPVVMKENQSEKYIQIVTVDGHDFWFMGFVNYEKACRHLTESLSSSAASGIPV